MSTYKFDKKFIKNANAAQTERTLVQISDIIDEARLDHEVEEQLNKAIQRYAEAFAHQRDMKRRGM